MASAIVLIKVENGNVEEIRKNLGEMPEVNKHYETHGMYEILSIIHSETITDLQKHVSSTIDEIEGVNTTLTLIVIDPEPEESEDDVSE
jgi:DNA-binding Lrp family transcriptional regulator